MKVVLDYSSEDEMEEKRVKRRVKQERDSNHLNPEEEGAETTLCRICGDTAVRHVHYGGRCCFSCKAFFRRAVNWQNKNSRNFQCKLDSSCEITIKNRKTCQSCRFQKCIDTGMNPTWVLSDDQRKKRFKKYRDQTGDLSPSSSQDSGEGENTLVVPRERRRVKSAPISHHILVEQAERQRNGEERLRGGKNGQSNPPTPRQKREKGTKAPRAHRFNSGPPRLQSFSQGGVSGSMVPIKLENMVLSPGAEEDLDDLACPLKPAISPVERSPLSRVEMCDLKEANCIKVEPDLDLESLHGLISTVDFSTVGGIAEEALRDKYFSVSMEDTKESVLTACGGLMCRQDSEDQGYHSHGTTGGIVKTDPPSPLLAGFQLSEEDMMALMKLDMSFENSNMSFPRMCDETSGIWETVVASRNFSKLHNSLTSTLLSEAVELCLKRNLIFLQENADFVSLSVRERTQLYIQNMRCLCHVRGVMQKAHFNNFTNFACSNQNNVLQISYEQRRTGVRQLWNVMDELTSADAMEAADAPRPQQQVSQDWEERRDQGMLQLEQTMAALKLERGAYLIMLFIVLYTSHGAGLSATNCANVDSLQNKYIDFLSRFLKAKHGPEATSHLTTIMKFLCSLLAKE